MFLLNIEDFLNFIELTKYNQFAIILGQLILVSFKKVLGEWESCDGTLLSVRGSEELYNSNK